VRGKRGQKGKEKTKEDGREERVMKSTTAGKKSMGQA